MRRITAIILMLVMVVSLAGCTFTPKSEAVSGANTDIGEQQNSEIDGNVIDEVMDEIQSDGIAEKLMSLGFTEEESAEQRKILVQCGIETIDSCESANSNATIDELVAYRVVIDEDRILNFTVENRSIFYVALNGEDLYNADEGGFVKTLDEVYVPETHVDDSNKIILRDIAEAELDKYFGYDTRYYDAWGIAREDDSYMVRCEVSDGNIFADRWVRACVWFEMKDGDYSVAGVQIDGKQYEVK